MRWDWIALSYVTYLLLASMTHASFRRARGPLVVACGAAWACEAAVVLWRPEKLAVGWQVVLPSLALLLGYRLSGLLFVSPNVRVEDWLQSVDDALLGRHGILSWFKGAPRWISEYFELCYALVYPAVPAGAAVLAVSGHSDQVGHFWTVVLTTEFLCYGMLPWIQTRPPRAREGVVIASPQSVRRLNLTLVDRASIQANTIPSGHAAGSLATALVLAETMPLVGAVFLVLAVSIAAATVLGRYHYAVDSILGIVVAVVVWSLM